MSKIIDALQKPVHGIKTQAKSAADNQQTTRSKSTKQATQQQLADIYFQKSKPSTSAPKESARQLPPPTVIRVAERGSGFLFPWIITLCALVLCSFALFSTKRIAIDVKVIDEAAVVQQRATGLQRPPADLSASKVKAQYHPALVIPVVKDDGLPEIKVHSPMDFDFAGSAVLNSTKQRSFLTLANSTLSRIGYGMITYRKPFDASAHRLFFEVRGQTGGEQVELIFKDKNGNSSLNWKTLQPFSDTGLASEWTPVTIEFEKTPYFDGSEIKQMRFEIGSQRTGNDPDAVVFLRNIQWLPIDAEDPSQALPEEMGASDL